MNQRLIVPAAVLMFLISIATVQARGGRGGGRGGGGIGGGGMGGGGTGNGTGTYNGNHRNQPTSKPAAATQPTPATRPSSSVEDQALAAAQQDLKKARTALNDLTAQLKTQYEQSPDFAAVVTQQKQAQDAYSAAYQADVATLKNAPEYQQALKDRIAAQKKVDDLHQGGLSASPDLMAASQASLAASQKVAQLEANSLANDPRMTGLKAAVLDASTKLATMRKGFESTLPTNPYWLAAKKELDDAQAKLLQAQKNAGD